MSRHTNNQKVQESVNLDDERESILSFPKKQRVQYSVWLSLLVIAYTIYVSFFGDFSETVNIKHRIILIVNYGSQFIPVAIWIIITYESIGVIKMLLAKWYNEELNRKRQEREDKIREEARADGNVEGWKSEKQVYEQVLKDKGIAITDIELPVISNDDDDT